MNEQANNPTTPSPTPAPEREMRSTDSRMRKNTIFRMVCLAATVLAILILVVLLLLSLVIVLAQGSALAPFIYALF